MLGTKHSQMPEESMGRIGLAAASQPLKSPMTETQRAVGAQTAKRTPGTPSRSATWAPSFS